MAICYATGILNDWIIGLGLYAGGLIGMIFTYFVLPIIFTRRSQQGTDQQ